MLKVYGDERSGNCYKVKLLLNLLQQDYQWQAVDVLKGETRSAEFLAKNPNGKIPLLELEDGSFLWESNAILNYLADGTAWMAFYCSTMLSMALELARENPAYEDMASKFFEHFVAIADAMNHPASSDAEIAALKRKKLKLKDEISRLEHQRAA